MRRQSPNKACSRPGCKHVAEQGKTVCGEPDCGGKTPSDYLCSNHSHIWVGVLANEFGVFALLEEKDRRVAIRKVLDEAAGYVPVARLPRPAEMRLLEVKELGVAADGHDYAVWLEHHCEL